MLAKQMMSNIKLFLGILLLAITQSAVGQSNLVNVFLGSSGDHGQLSPAAGGPFGIMSVGPQTYPHGHTGYEFKAKKILGLTHTRFEGVGCMGSGGNILITPFIKNDQGTLIKRSESALPGNYAISFTNGISVAIQANDKYALEKYTFPAAENGFMIDLSHTLANAFRSEVHTVASNMLTGEIRSGTTCSNGTYILYYAISFDQPVSITEKEKHQVQVNFKARSINVQVAFSSVSIELAKDALRKKVPGQIVSQGRQSWDYMLGRIKVTGDKDETALFYSLLYRVLQSPFLVSEKGAPARYNGWSIWDNYKTQLPLLSLAYPNEYQDIITSLTDLYKRGKKNWATDQEPSNSVRTEHAVVVLLDAYRKGYQVDLQSVKDSLLKEASALEFDKPDKALESCYDSWAFAEIFKILKYDSLANRFYQQASQWKTYWDKDFKDLGKNDVDRLPARGMYQGTIWQYRWLVPFDIKGLIAACGGEAAFIQQLSAFFDNDYYNATNETDIQAPYMFSGTGEPWRSQEVIRRYAHDTVVQHYFNDNSRGIDAFVGRVYQNRPDAYPRTMDDDGGAMSAWYVLAAMGLSPACVGHPVYYLHVPLFEKVSFYPSEKAFTIEVKNFGKENKYIRSVSLNGKPLNRNWLTQDEIKRGGKLIIHAADQPDKNFGIKDQWKSNI